MDQAQPLVAQPLVIDEQKLNDLGVRLFALYETHKRDRRAAEEHWLKNLRQFRGIYDPEIFKLIPKECSKAYPKVTRWKVIGTVARLMQMLFPNTEKNYETKQSTLSELSVDHLQQVLDKLVATKGANPDGTAPTLDQLEIEKAVNEFAAGRAERMQLKIDDDLKGMEYTKLARRVVFSSTLYNIGILEGPMHEEVPYVTWEQNQHTGKYTAIQKTRFKPLFEFLRVWDWYPDMTAVSLDKQDGSFVRRVMTRIEVEALASRPDFLTDRINNWLRENSSGNYTPQWWEGEIKSEPKSDRIDATREGRKYEVASYFGTASGHELRAAGINIPDADLGKSLNANCWMLDNIVIKARLTPLGGDIARFHTFMFEEDDLNLLGNGQCDTLRDSQLSICEATRATLDNSSVVGPSMEVNDDLLTPGQDTQIRKHKVWHREGDGASSQYPAVRDISVNSHLTELTALIAMFMDFADKEAGLPPPSLGDVSGGGSEALRTSQNASMFLGAAALPIRDTVRNFDSFTVSVISALVAWNKKYAPDQTRDGDHEIFARGSTSLIAKEVLSAALNEFRASVTPDEMPHLKPRAMLVARMKVNDLPVEDFLEDEDKANQIVAQNAQMQQAQVNEQMKLISAQVEQALTNALKNAAQARQIDASIGIDVFEQIVKGIEAGDKSAIEKARTMIEDKKVPQNPIGGAT